MKENLLLKKALLLMATMFLAMSAIAQDLKVSLTLKNASPRQFFRAIERQTPYRFSFRDVTIDNKGDITFSCVNTTVKSVLTQVLPDHNLTYQMVTNKNIAIYKKDTPPTSDQTDKQKNGTKKVKMVRGHIVDSQGEPIVGAVVRVKGTGRGVSTDVDGNFQIEASPNEQLDVSYIGFKSQKLNVNEKKNYDIKLEEEKTQLDEVVVTAYGAGQKKASVVGAIETINPENLQVGSTRSMSNNLAGQIAGVIAIQRTGEPGYDNSNFWIRGISTFSGDTNPLVLIDGVERDLNNIDPAEIESFSVLKDASASAMYGVRGANGVIIINTKRGKVGKPTTDIRIEHAISAPTRLPKYLNGPDYMRLRNELQTDKTNPYYSEEDIRRTETGYDPDLYPNVNWMDVCTKDYAYNTRANVSVNGGSDFLRYALVTSWYNESGIIQRDPTKDYDTSIKLNRYNVRANVDVNLTKTTLLRLNVGGYLQNRRGPAQSVTSGLYLAQMEIPIEFPPIYSDSAIPRRPVSGSGGINPWAFLTQFGYSDSRDSQIQSLVSLEQQLDMITKGLKFRATFAFDSYNWVGRYRTVNPTQYMPATGRDEYGHLQHEIVLYGDESMSFRTSSNYGSSRTYLELAGTYQHAFGIHDFDVLFLYNQQSYDPGSYQPYRKQGIAGRLAYTLAGRYIMEFNFGYNGSENFAKGHRFGFFPSIAGGWIPSEEKFWESIKKTVNKLKFRVSYGKVGNDNIGGRRFAYLSTVVNQYGYKWGETSSIQSSGLTEGEIGVSNLTWETAWKQNYGVELGLWNALDVHFDYFIENRSNIFMQRNTIPDLLGFSTKPWANYGKVRNKGYELSLNYNKRFNKNFQINVRGTYSYAKNKILEMDEPAGKIGTYRAQTGHSMNELYGLLAERLFTKDDFEEDGSLKEGIPVQSLGTSVQPGDIKYKDLNNDGYITEEDKTYLGRTRDPRAIYGFGASMQWKAWDFSFFFQGNRDTWNCVEGGISPNGLARQNFYSNAWDRWTEDYPSQNVFYPRCYENINTNNEAVSTWWLKDMSMCRLKTIEVGYSLPKNLLRRIGINSTRFYVSGNNLLLLSGWKLWDPELSTSMGTVYPPMKSVMFGMELNF